MVNDKLTRLETYDIVVLYALLFVFGVIIEF